MSAHFRRAYALPIAASVALVWFVGILAHDPWLRPWSDIATYCAIYSIVVTLLLWTCSKRSWAWILAPVVLLLTVALGIPTPSFRRSVSVHNTLTVPIFLRFTAVAGARQKEMILAPNAKWVFTYFAGDHGKEETIPVRLEVEDRSSRATVSRMFALPVSRPGPEITISTNWFAPEK